MLPDEIVIKPTSVSMRWNLIKSSLFSLTKMLYIVVWLESFSITIYFKIGKILWSCSASPCQQLWECAQWSHNKRNGYSPSGFLRRLTTDILLGQKGYQKSQAPVDTSSKSQKTKLTWFGLTWLNMALTLGNILYFANNIWDFELLNKADKERI